MTPAPPQFPERVRDSLRNSSDFLSPVNALVFAVVTILDIATPTMEKSASRLIALIAAGMVAILLYRLNAARLDAAAAPGLSFGRAFFRRKANKILLLVVPFVVGIAWAGLAHAYPRGVFVAAVPATEAIQDAVLSIRKDVGDVKTSVVAINNSLNPTDARGRLAKMHYGFDDESKARAIEACDLDALRLYVEAHESLPAAVPVFGTRGGSVLEKPIAALNSKLPDTLRLLAAQGMRFDARYPLTFTQSQSAAIPQFAELVQTVPVPLQLGFLPSYVHANPLAIAVWFNNAETVKTLVELGADPNVGVDAMLPELRNGQIVGGQNVRQVSSAAKEAKRLNRSALFAKTP